MIKNPRFEPIGKGYSLFKFIGKYSLEEKSGRAIDRSFHRLCTLMRKMDVKSVVVEDVMASNKLIKRECSAINSYFDQLINFKAFRLTFLAEEITSLNEIAKCKEDNFLASAIIINFGDSETNWKTYIYSAIVVIPRLQLKNDSDKIPLLNNYLHLYKTFPCEVKISNKKVFKFNITGTFFCQQNSKTSFCAHAALCMTVNNMGIYNIDMISSEDINKIIGIDHKKRKFSPHTQGLSKDEFEMVLDRLKLSYTWMDFFENPNIDYNEYVYRYIESRCPVILAFSTDTVLHVVPVLGHTLNSDIWRSEAEAAYASQESRLIYKSTAAWVDHFIIHDDNFGMYLCMPVDSIKRITLPKYDPTFRIRYAVVITPKALTTPAWEAEWASVLVTKYYLQSLINSGEPLDEWSSRIILSETIHQPRPIVVRTLLLHRQEYIKSIEYEDFEGNSFSESEKNELTKNLPELFWLSEITLPDIYTANKTKIVDFFYDCEHKPLVGNYDDISNRWIQIRFPHVLLRRESDGSRCVTSMSVSSHYPLVRFERENDTLDW